MLREVADSDTPAGVEALVMLLTLSVTVLLQFLAVRFPSLRRPRLGAVALPPLAALEMAAHALSVRRLLYEAVRPARLGAEDEGGVGASSAASGVWAEWGGAIAAALERQAGEAFSLRAAAADPASCALLMASSLALALLLAAPAALVAGCHWFARGARPGRLWLARARRPPARRTEGRVPRLNLAAVAAGAPGHPLGATAADPSASAADPGAAPSPRWLAVLLVGLSPLNLDLLRLLRWPAAAGAMAASSPRAARCGAMRAPLDALPSAALVLLCAGSAGLLSASQLAVQGLYRASLPRDAPPTPLILQASLALAAAALLLRFVRPALLLLSHVWRGGRGANAVAEEGGKAGGGGSSAISRSSSSRSSHASTSFRVELRGRGAGQERSGRSWRSSFGLAV